MCINYWASLKLESPNTVTAQYRVFNRMLLLMYVYLLNCAYDYCIRNVHVLYVPAGATVHADK